jgi:hypothetical protein
MSDSIIRTQPVREVRDEFRADLGTFEDVERRLLAEDRRDRARELSACFAVLALDIG